MRELVSVIIPSYNRFKYLLNAVESVKKQTYKNLEIIIINDGSDQQEYYTHNFQDDNIPVKIIHLKTNSKLKFGYPCQAYVRTVGCVESNPKTKYIAFLDDDDIWFPDKLLLQIKAMKRTGSSLSCTEGLIGTGIYQDKTIYKKYITDHSHDRVKKIFINAGSNYLDHDIYPEIWGLDFIKIHNCIVASSVVIKKKILQHIDFFKFMSGLGEDYHCWLKALELTNCVFVNQVCFYYDDDHGDGCNWS